MINTQKHVIECPECDREAEVDFGKPTHTFGEPTWKDVTVNCECGFSSTWVCSFEKQWGETSVYCPEDY